MRSVSPSKSAAKDTRTEIIEAAADLFSKKGYDGTKIVDIARQLGIAHTLIIYHFKNKEALWRETIEYCNGRLFRDFDDALKDTVGLPPTERLKVLMRRLIRHNIVEPRSFPIITIETQNAGPRLTWLLKEYLKPIYALFDAVVAEAQAAGLIRADVPPFHLSQIIIGSCSHFTAASVRLKRIYGSDASSPVAYERHMELAIDTVFNGFSVRTPAAS